MNCVAYQHILNSVAYQQIVNSVAYQHIVNSVAYRHIINSVDTNISVILVIVIDVYNSLTKVT